MKNRTVKILTVVLALICFLTLGAYAAEEKTSGDFTYVVQSDNTVKLISFDGETKGADIVIPSEIEGKAVTVLGENFMDSAFNVNSVTIPESITLIEEYAFYWARIAEINVAEGNAYYSSDENGVLFNKDKTELIRYCTYNDRTEYAIPDTVTSLRKWSFLNAINLKNVIFPASLEVIGVHTFESCSFDNLIIPGSVKEIGESAFAECNVDSLYIENGVEEIGHNAFLYCENINTFFSGTRAQWEAINIAYSNYNIENVHYNASYPFDHAAAYTETAEGEFKCGERIVYSYTCTCGDSYKAWGYAPGHEGGNRTCTKKAVCSRCGEEYGGLEDHNYKAYTIKATLSKDGRTGIRCADCNAGETHGKISRPKKFTLSTTEYTYNGKEKKPSVTVKDADGKTISKSYYTVKYESGRKLPGEYTVTITFKGNYEGTKKLTFKILPKTTSKVTSTGYTKSVKLTWSKVTGADGYRIYYKSGDTWKTVAKSVKGTTYTVKNLKSGTKRTYAIRAYKKDGSTTLWSERKAFSVSTKPGKATLTAKSSSPGTATLTWKSVKGANTYRVYYKVNKGEYKLYKTYSKPTKVTLKGLRGGYTYTFRVKAGIKVTGGTVWGDVAAKSVKITYRTTPVLKAMKSGNFLIRTTAMNRVSTTTAVKDGNKLYVSTEDDYGDVYRMVYIASEKRWYYIYDQYKFYMIVEDSQLEKSARGSELLKELKEIEVPTKFGTEKGRDSDGNVTFHEIEYGDGYRATYIYRGTTLIEIDTDYDSGLGVRDQVKKFTTNVPDSLFSIPKDYTYVS